MAEDNRVLVLPFDGSTFHICNKKALDDPASYKASCGFEIQNLNIKVVLPVAFVHFNKAVKDKICKECLETMT